MLWPELVQCKQAGNVSAVICPDCQKVGTYVFHTYSWIYFERHACATRQHLAKFRGVDSALLEVYQGRELGGLSLDNQGSGVSVEPVFTGGFG